MHTTIYPSYVHDLMQKPLYLHECITIFHADQFIETTSAVNIQTMKEKPWTLERGPKR